MHLVLINSEGKNINIANPKHIPRVGERVLWEPNYWVTVDSVGYDYNANLVYVTVS